MPQQEELQGGGKSGNLKVSSVLFLLSYFLNYFVFSSYRFPSPPFSFFCCEEDNDAIVILVFYCFIGVRDDNEQLCCSLSLFYGLATMKKTMMLSLSFFFFFVAMTTLLSLSSFVTL